MKNLVTNGFKNYSANDLLGKCTFILSQMTDNVAVFANPTPSLPTLETAANELKTAIAAAGARDSIKVALRDEKQAEMVSLLQTLGLYVDLVADGSRLVAQLSGFDVRKVAAPRVLQTPAAPKAVRAKMLGSIDARCGAQQAAKSYQWYVTTDSSLALTEWKAVEGTSKVTLTDCTPGVAYYICAVVVGFRNQRAQSPVVKVVA